MKILRTAGQAALDALFDTARLLPLLFLTYLLLEWIEHHARGRAARLVSRAGSAGPLLGAALGLLPQCGFSGAMASLYGAGAVSLGTLLAVFLSTSDEMLPVMVAAGAPARTMGAVLLCKFGYGVAAGFAIDLAARARRLNAHSASKNEAEDNLRVREICESEHCACRGRGVVIGALVHTAKIALSLVLVTAALNFALALIGREAVGRLLGGAPPLAAGAAALVGLLPGCAVSVILTQLFLEGTIGGGALLAGLFANAGAGLLVLARTLRAGGKGALRRMVGIALLLAALAMVGGLLLGWAIPPVGGTA